MTYVDETEERVDRAGERECPHRDGEASVDLDASVRTEMLRNQALPTCLKSRDSGRPLSLENAQACLEAEATKPKVAEMYMAMSRDVNAVVPAFDCKAL